MLWRGRQYSRKQKRPAVNYLLKKWSVRLPAWYPVCRAGECPYASVSSPYSCEHLYSKSDWLADYFRLHTMPTRSKRFRKPEQCEGIKQQGPSRGLAVPTNYVEKCQSSVIKENSAIPTCLRPSTILVALKTIFCPLTGANRTSCSTGLCLIFENSPEATTLPSTDN